MEWNSQHSGMLLMDIKILNVKSCFKFIQLDFFFKQTKKQIYDISNRFANLILLATLARDVRLGIFVETWKRFGCLTVSHFQADGLESFSLYDFSGCMAFYFL